MSTTESPSWPAEPTGRWEEDRRGDRDEPWGGGTDQRNLQPVAMTRVPFAPASTSVPPLRAVTPARTGDGWSRLLPWAGLVLGGALFASMLTLLVSTVYLTPGYRSSSTMMVRTVPDPAQVFGAGVDDDSIYETFLAGEAIAPTFRELAKRPSVLSPVAATSGLSVGTLADNLSVRTVPQTPLIVVSYSDPDPRRSMMTADAIAASLSRTTTEEQLIPGREIIVVEPAPAPRSPVTPRPWLNATIAFVAVGSVLIGVAYAVEANRQNMARYAGAMSAVEHRRAL